VLQLSFPGAEPNFRPPSLAVSTRTTRRRRDLYVPGVITCNAPSQSISSNGLLSGSTRWHAQFAGYFTIGGTASGYSVAPNDVQRLRRRHHDQPRLDAISFTQVPSSQQVTVTQLPTGSTLTAAINCPGGSSAASVTLTGRRRTEPLTFTVTRNSAPTSNPPPTVACTIIVAGQGDGPVPASRFPVNVTSTGIGVETHRRKPNYRDIE